MFSGTMICIAAWYILLKRKSELCIAELLQKREHRTIPVRENKMENVLPKWKQELR